MDCRVVVEAAVPVYSVETADEAMRIAIAKTGDMLNPDLNYVEITIGERSCPACGEAVDAAFIATDEGLVASNLKWMSSLSPTKRTLSGSPSQRSASG